MNSIVGWYWKFRLIQARRKHARARGRVIKTFNRGGHDGEAVAAMLDDIYAEMRKGAEQCDSSGSS